MKAIVSVLCVVSVLFVLCVGIITANALGVHVSLGNSPNVSTATASANTQTSNGNGTQSAAVAAAGAATANNGTPEASTFIEQRNGSCALVHEVSLLKKTEAEGQAILGVRTKLDVGDVDKAFAAQVRAEELARKVGQLQADLNAKANVPAIENANLKAELASARAELAAAEAEKKALNAALAAATTTSVDYVDPRCGNKWHFNRATNSWSPIQ